MNLYLRTYVVTLSDTPYSLVRLRPSAQFSVGMPIEANLGRKGKYYRGTIVRMQLNGNYEVKYDDGETEENVSAGDIRALLAGESRKFKFKLRNRNRNRNCNRNRNRNHNSNSIPKGQEQEARVIVKVGKITTSSV